MKLPWRRVLALSPHCDDVEVGAGATIARLLREGAEVLVYCFSFCRESVPAGFSPTVTFYEWHESMEALGIKKDNRQSEDYPVRRFPDYRQEILEDLIHMWKTCGPFDLVITPNVNDMHQDHHVLAMEAWRAFKDKATVLGWESIKNQAEFVATAVLEVSHEDVDKKITALRCYRSQEHRHPWEYNWITALAHVTGRRVNVELAEAFSVQRLTCNIGS